MRWMLEKVGEDWDELNPRVAAESEAAREKEEALKRERVKRGEQARRERLEAVLDLRGGGRCEGRCEGGCEGGGSRDARAGGG